MSTVVRYPRDMQGYGATPPVADWPKSAAICVQFVVNYEEGGESCLLHGDSASEAFLSEIVGAQAWEGQRHWNMESIYEYGARAGFWRLHRLFTGLEVPVTVYGVATALRRGPAQVHREGTWTGRALSGPRRAGALHLWRGPSSVLLSCSQPRVRV